MRNGVGPTSTGTPVPDRASEIRRETRPQMRRSDSVLEAG